LPGPPPPRTRVVVSHDPGAAEEANQVLRLTASGAPLEAVAA
jgi:hypothetical protein